MIESFTKPLKLLLWKSTQVIIDIILFCIICVRFSLNVCIQDHGSDMFYRMCNLAIKFDQVAGIFVLVRFIDYTQITYTCNYIPAW